MNKGPRILTALLAVAGVGVAGYLTWMKRESGLNPDFQSICNINSSFNCDVVNASQYSMVWGIPLALYGVGFYLAILVIAAVSLGGSERARRAPVLAWGLSILAVFLSAVLAFISKSQIGVWCPMCMALYAINLGLLGTTWASMGAGFSALVAELDEELKGFYRNPVLFACGAVFAGTLFLGSAWMGDAAAAGSGATAARPGAAPGADAGAAQGMDEGQVTLDSYRETTPVDIPLTGEEPFKGGASAKVVIVEFADFECPWCARAADCLYQVAETFGDQVKIIYKHVPLDQKCNPMMQTALHEDSCAASVATVCAGQQGQFWEMHRTLFSNQSHLKERDLLDYAENLGLDMGAFGACRQSPEAARAVTADIQAAGALKIEGTPTVYVNGRQIKGNAIVRPDLMEVLIQDLLAQPAN